jgi:hypothetical protein
MNEASCIFAIHHSSFLIHRSHATAAQDGRTDSNPTCKGRLLRRKMCNFRSCSRRIPGMETTCRAAGCSRGEVWAGTGSNSEPAEGRKASRTACARERLPACSRDIPPEERKGETELRSRQDRSLARVAHLEFRRPCWLLRKSKEFRRRASVPWSYPSPFTCRFFGKTFLGFDHQSLSPSAHADRSDHSAKVSGHRNRVSEQSGIVRLSGRAFPTCAA